MRQFHLLLSTCVAAAAGLCFVPSGQARGVPFATPSPNDFGGYPLDAVARDAPAPGTPLECNTDELVVYRGTHLRFSHPARVYRELVPRIAQLEQILIDAGVAVYGRAPSRFVHMGGFNCRPIRLEARMLSEHAFGNAIDLAGVDFAALRRRDPLPEALPPSLRRSFRVRVLEDWRGTENEHAIHARYWTTVRNALLANPQLFRGILGPGYPAHDNHLHFDMAPWQMHVF